MTSDNSAILCLVTEEASKPRLKKEIGLVDLYAVSTGATLSAGFFLLPGIAAQEVGSALVLAYLIAALPMVPAMFSVVELATAMPRAGGVYYFLDRALGPLIGTIGGIGTWLALVLKVSFALVGMGAYIHLFVDAVPMRALAVGLAIGLGVLNLFGSKKSGRLQILLVGGLLTLLGIMIGGGLSRLELAHFEDFTDVGFASLMSTAGLVYISYVGVTKVASLSEEVADPERNLPRAVFLSLGTAVLVYVLGTLVMVGVVPVNELAGDLTVAATAATKIFGEAGKIAISIAAILAFTSVANAGTLSASRYPLAMSRDHILPRSMGRIGKSGTPIYGVLSTVGITVVILVALDPSKIAKLASAFQLLMFAIVCVAVIVMRESQIDSYDPGYPSPLYPWMQIAGIVLPLFLITEMGWLSVLFSAVLVAVSMGWYFWYASDKVAREGAIYHLFERLGRRRFEGLDRELRGILKEKGLRQEDPFDEIVARSFVIEAPEALTFDELVDLVSPLLAERADEDVGLIKDGLLQGTRIGATPVTHGVALPHVRLDHLAHPEMVLVRSKTRIIVPLDGNAPAHSEPPEVFALFFLASPQADPALHLRILAQIAGRVDEDSFQQEWEGARDDHALKEVLLRDERFLTLRIAKARKTAPFVGRALREVSMPEDTLITVVRRHGEAFVPRGSTVLREGDRVTIIGTPERIRELDVEYNES